MGMYQQGKIGEHGTEGKSPQIQHLRPNHRGMARAVALGNTNPMALANTYCLTPGQISRIMGSPVFQAEVARLEREVEVVSFDMAKDLQLMGEKAIQNIDEDLHINPDTLDHRKLRNQTSIDVLAMLGLRKSGENSRNVTNVLNVTQNNYSKAVEELDERELREEVLDLLESNGTYE